MAVMTEVLMIAALAGTAMLLARFLLGYLHFRKLEMAIPGPPSLPLLGNALDFMRATPDTIMQTLLELTKGCRKMSRLSIFSHMIIAIQDPSEIKEVMRRHEFGNKAFFLYRLLEATAKKGLVQLSGAEWKAHRKWLAPGFNQNVLDRLVTIFCEEANGFVDRVVTDKEVDVLDNLRKALMRDFLRTSMTAEGSQFDDDLMEAVEAIKVFMYSVNARAFNPLLWPDQIFALTSLGRKSSRMMGRFDLMVKRLLAEKRKQLGNKESNHDFERARKTLVDIMLETPDVDDGKHMTEQDIVDEFKTFMVANVETSMFVLSMALKVLSLMPDVQQLAYSEAVSVLGDRDVTCVDLSKLCHWQTVSLVDSVTVSLAACVTVSLHWQRLCDCVTGRDCVTVSLVDCMTVSLADCVIVSLADSVTVSLADCITGRLLCDCVTGRLCDCVTGRMCDYVSVRLRDCVTG
ncbi:putative inactive cytochrome P450 family member 4Z2 [Thrips palmi]|uniref:Inactive cytochrome P450 family member 4Z2 n=1 Tax=Thrips palmi TaxID=161013 RepID=A0A6P8ZYS1_THRPL|nr:putative inactive cytochrome P450 family member 4Z2 [Thrips palmi]